MLSLLLRKLWPLIVIAVLALGIFSPDNVAAQSITESRLKSLINNRPFFDSSAVECSDSTIESIVTGTNPGGETGSGTVYVLGDSITEQVKTLYESTLKAKGYTATINASSGRSITGKGTSSSKSSGLEAIEADAATIKNATTIIVALGTNGNNDATKVGKLIDKIRALNASAKILWVDTMVVGRPSYVPTINESNQGIYGAASTKKYSVVSWAKAVSPGVDPQHLSGTETDPNGYIRQADQYVHPTPAGQKPLVDLVVGVLSSTAELGEQGAPSNAVLCGSKCTAGTGGIIPVTGENVEKMFKYFVSLGLSAAQAAGITGNAMVESGESIDPNASNSGNYRGIFQWDTAGRWARLVSWANSQKKDPLLFDTQLEYAKIEAESRGNIEGIKKQDSVELATWYWGRYFEVAIINGSKSEEPLTNVQMLKERTAYARSVLDKYGGDTGNIDTPDTSNCNDGGSTSAKVGNLAWPVDKKFWDENPIWFTKPHHDYPAADIPVPTGTTVYSISDGKAQLTNPSGDCGTGIIIQSGNVQFTYCHGVPGSMKVESGQDVHAGQELFKSDNTGHSFGAHLHVQLKVSGTKHCPQSMFQQMGDGITDIDLGKLPTSGCTN